MTSLPCRCGVLLRMQELMQLYVTRREQAVRWQVLESDV